MDLFDGFPYTNMHELNLDWILREMKKLSNRVGDFTPFNGIISEKIEINKDKNTGRFWNTVYDIYNAMEDDSAKYVLLDVTSSFNSVADDEPKTGDYLVEIVRRRLKDGYIKACGRENSSGTINTITEFYKVRSEFSWSQKVFLSPILLWSNASVTSGIATDTIISLPAEAKFCKGLLVEVMLNPSIDYNYKASFVMKVGGTCCVPAEFPAGYIGSRQITTTKRYFTWEIDKTSFVCRQGLVGSGFNNNACVPYRIYGIYI